MGAAAEGLADVVDIRAYIKPFAAHDAEVDFGQGDPIDCVAIDVHQARLALDHFSLARELVKRHASVFFRGDHWRQLIKIAPELFKRSANLIFIQRGDRPLLNYLALSILRVGRHAEHKCASILFIFAHEQILNLCTAPNGKQQQSGRDRIKRAAMTDFLGGQFSPR